MKIKRLISALAAISMFPVSAFAATEVNIAPVDMSTNTVKVDGIIDSKKADEVMIIVTTPDFDLDSAAATNEIVYQLKKTADKNGKYNFEFILNPLTGVFGDYEVYISTADGKNQATSSFYYGDASARTTAVTDINTAIANDDGAGSAVNTITANLNTYANAVGLSSDSFAPLAKAAPAVIAKAIVANGAFTDDRAGYDKLQEIIIKTAVLDCYNNTTVDNSVLVGTDGTIKYAGELGLGKNSTLLNVYNDVLSTTGQEAVVKSMREKKFADADEFAATFAASVAVNGIKNGKEAGSGHISKILTAENKTAISAGLAGETKTKWEAAVNSYLANSSYQNEINSNLLKMPSCNSIEELTTGIQKAIDAAKTNNTRPPSSSGGISSGVGGGMSGPGANSGSTGGNTGTTEKVIFNDIAGHWAEKDMIALYKNGVLSGYPDGSCKPENFVKREEGLKMVCEAFGISGIDTEISFRDVPNGAWFEKYVRMGVEKDIIKGFDAVTFGAGRNVTRQDLAVMIYRAAGSPKVTADVKFTDADEISGYAKDAVAYLYELGAMGGYPDGSIKPANFIKRAELAKLLNVCMKEEAK